jgi:hydrogenase expression/formation protein HypD
MKYIEDFRNSSVASILVEKIKRAVEPGRHYKFMEFCGGHTHAIHRNGLPNLLPNNIEMVHGPGCPVCILPISRMNQAITLAQLPDVIFCSYGDMLRVPGSNKMSLLKAKANGANVKMVYSVDDALIIAQQNPTKKIIFFAIGFETTTPPSACALIKAKALKLTNFFIFCNHVLTPPALASLLQQENQAMIHLDGFIGPAHVSIIIGSQGYEAISKKYHKPIVIAGFEPLDLLHAVLMLVQQLNENRCEVENQYTRAVTARGNVKSQRIMMEAFELRASFEWRGLGSIANSAFQIKQAFQLFDAEKQFIIPYQDGKEHKGCECANVLRGLKKPTECKLFAKVCTPENPIGSCMVSSEGACSAVYSYGRL